MSEQKTEQSQSERIVVKTPTELNAEVGKRITKTDFDPIEGKQLKSEIKKRVESLRKAESKAQQSFVQRLSKMFQSEAYLLYFFDSESMNSRLFPLHTLESEIRLKKTNETFYLSNPAFWLNGNPLFVIMRECPFSLKFEMLNQKDRMKFIEVGYSASEIDAKINSIYTQKIFRTRMYDTGTWVLLILSNLLTFCVAYIITVNSVKSGG